MIILNSIVYYLMIFQVGQYIIQSIFFLIRPLNKPQKFFNRIFVIVQVILSFVIIALWYQNYTSWKRDMKISKEHQHIDPTSLDAIEEREDIFREERNMYLYGCTFFLSLANSAYFNLLHNYYADEDKAKKIKNM